MKEITEHQLIEKLKTIRTPSETEAFIKKYVPKEHCITFYEYLQQYIADKALPVADVMNNSRINKNYGYNIINGTRDVLKLNIILEEKGLEPLQV